MNYQQQPSAAGARAEDHPSRVTPMMEQYVEIRAANPDCLLFYRMGDFYELFFGDAVIASRALGIALTKRGKHLGEDIPMCGVPVHAADDYLQKLISLGHRVAVCEQMEDPAEARRRGARSVVRREVRRLVTPGTVTEDGLLDSRRHNYLAALAKVPGSAGDHRCAVAWTDISTGEFRVSTCEPDGLAVLLARIEPRELLVADRLAEEPDVRDAIAATGAALTPLPAAFFDSGSAERRLCTQFRVASMEAYGAFARGELSVAAALVAYVEKTQVAQRPSLLPPERVGERDTMRIDAATRANLELFQTLSGGRAGSLLANIDRTLTAAGSRLLAERLANPLCDPARIEERLDAVAFFRERSALAADIRHALATVPDMLRGLSRLSLQRGGPRDLDMVRAGLEGAASIAGLLPAAELLPVAHLRMAHDRLASLPESLAAGLAHALADELPLLRRDGGFVRAGYDAALDEARALRDESRRITASLQARYAEASGIRSLKVRHNNVLGYFIEVTAGQAPSLQASANAFVHRQTLANVMRFSTAELVELEQKIATAAERAIALENEIFDRLNRMIEAEMPAIRNAAAALAEIDVAAALASLAIAEKYVRPIIDSGLAFDIEAGRHPVVEAALKSAGQSFVANDCKLGAQGDNDHGRIWLLTGPNMAGKSTFLRQNALIAILAQAGCYVPARRAHIGIVDAVFSRVGAADDLARGRSTFMVEMVETAAILNQAGPRALVILDEIGRGTATFDGLSIAWAVIERLHEENNCRALFATHYHELTALNARLSRLTNVTMTVKEWKDDVVFLHEVAPGAADRSYGIQVAKLAGLPASVVARARQVLESLEKSDRNRPPGFVDDLPLFARAPTPEQRARPTAALAALDAIEPDELSPKDALEAIYALKKARRDEN